MAQSKCSCGNSFFEMKEVSPRGARFKYYFIQCSTCGNVVSSTDYFNVPAEMQTLKNEISNLQSKIRNQEQKINFLVDGMERILRSLR